MEVEYFLLRGTRGIENTIYEVLGTYNTAAQLHSALEDEAKLHGFSDLIPLKRLIARLDIILLEK